MEYLRAKTPPRARGEGSSEDDVVTVAGHALITMSSAQPRFAGTLPRGQGLHRLFDAVSHPASSRQARGRRWKGTPGATVAPPAPATRKSPRLSRCTSRTQRNPMLLLLLPGSFLLRLATRRFVASLLYGASLAQSPPASAEREPARQPLAQYPLLVERRVSNRLGKTLFERPYSGTARTGGLGAASGTRGEKIGLQPSTQRRSVYRPGPKLTGGCYAKSRHACIVSDGAFHRRLVMGSVDRFQLTRHRYRPERRRRRECPDPRGSSGHKFQPRSRHQ